MCSFYLKMFESEIVWSGKHENIDLVVLDELKSHLSCSRQKESIWFVSSFFLFCFWLINICFYWTNYKVAIFDWNNHFFVLTPTFCNWNSNFLFYLNYSEPPPAPPTSDDDDEQPASNNKPSESNGGQTNSRPQNSLPQQFRPSQPGVRLVG